MRRSRGMTLLEVMLSLVVFATAALGVQFAVGQHLNSMSHIEQKMFATMVADNQMALVKIDGRAPSSTRQGKTELAGVEWYWRVQSVDTAEGLLKAVDVTVYTDSQRKNSVHSVRTYLGG
ncbi:type II secretion system minor pseudopilin GspI [Thaumasiovibrio subtropicus]|uniref:type II secretion system minor pseudopilin GspI n=1 Tax=Thaumasiovibrio subtropicus TaxID=1891207 RepID=UPI000B35E913|nr:type II secretion system minor pseudopilin GspI [Thaumasiovibrio subtropicus]